VRRAAEALFEWSGALGAIRNRRRDRLRIFMYHRFDWVPGAADALARQCAHLRGAYAPVTLDAVADHLEAGRPFPPNAVAVTVDDGHADFERIALPVFLAHGIPVTLYLATDFVDGAAWLWFDRIEYALRRTRRPSFVDPLSGDALPLATRAERSAAFVAVVERAKAIPDAALRRLPADVAAALDVDLPAAAPAEYSAVSWETVRRMQGLGVEIGAHTRSHPILSRLPGRDALEEEIAGSSRRIEEMTGTPARHFCYPNGRDEDLTPETVDIVRGAGFRTAVTTVPGLADLGSDPLRLRRIGAGPEIPTGYFRRAAAGYRIS
jgi:peptidoglycan/xylan/chitin deacetylase (PgdA/CDA1 family)